MKRFAWLLIVCLLAAMPVQARAEVAGRAGDVVVSAPWARATAPNAPTGAAYLTLTNDGRGSDRLIAIRSPVAETAELHTHLMDAGIMRMRPVDAVEITPGSPTVFQPGGLHVMLVGLKQPLRKDETFPLTLVFELSGEVTVPVTVLSPGATRPESQGAMEHHGQT